MEELNQIKQLHDRIMIIMKEIHEICVKNNIEYSLAGGSLIGAMRHKGFIPWDDDMDVMMPYSDYKRFLDLVFSTNHQWLEFEVAGYTKGCYRTILKAYDKRTTLIQTENSVVRGVFVDIFPYVYVGNTYRRAKFEYYLHHAFEAPLARKINVYKEFNIVKETLLTMLGKCVPAAFWIWCMNKQYDRLKEKKTIYSSDLDGTLGGIMPSSCFEGVELRQFEDYRFFCLCKAHEYLTNDYGDYMKLPPVEQQKPHHIAYLNTELPYREYKL